ncbi:MAG: dockerin type I repeat-containing protein [Planctomycetes bacterium]|nr:dockerin type I repeat-containing protein [Planctomycetota bacterium]
MRRRTGGFRRGVLPLVVLVVVASEGTGIALQLGCDEPPFVTGFVRGDANGDGAVSIADAIALLAHLFESAELPCVEAADASGDRGLDIGDAIYLLSYLFSAGPPPPAPFPTPGGIAIPEIPSLWVQDPLLIGATDVSVTRTVAGPALVVNVPSSAMIFHVDAGGVVLGSPFENGESLDAVNHLVSGSETNALLVWENGPVIFDDAGWYAPDFSAPSGLEVLYDTFAVAGGTGDFSNVTALRCAVLHSPGRWVAYDDWTGKLFYGDALSALPASPATFPHHDAPTIESAICAVVDPCPFGFSFPDPVFSHLTELEEVHGTSEYLAYEMATAVVLRGDLFDSDPASLEVLLVPADVTPHTGESTIELRALEIDAYGNLYVWDAVSATLLRGGWDGEWATLLTAAQVAALTGIAAVDIEDMAFDRHTSVLYLMDAASGSIVVLAPGP